MEYKGIKQNWKTIDNCVRVDYLGGSFKICEVLVDMPYPATNEQGKAHLQLIESAPKMMTALEKISEILDSEEMNVNSKEYKLWEIANNALKCALENER